MQYKTDKHEIHTHAKLEVEQPIRSCTTNSQDQGIKDQGHSMT